MIHRKKPIATEEDLERLHGSEYYHDRKQWEASCKYVESRILARESVFHKAALMSKDQGIVMGSQDPAYCQLLSSEPPEKIHRSNSSPPNPKRSKTSATPLPEEGEEEDDDDAYNNDAFENHEQVEYVEED
jgi:hypothetical protein